MFDSSKKWGSYPKLPRCEAASAKGLNSLAASSHGRRTVNAPPWHAIDWFLDNQWTVVRHVPNCDKQPGALR
jgi:hypothetical protein